MNPSREPRRLSPRDLEVLDAVVQLNIETGRPVSSGLVERFLQRAMSSATIRSVMKFLEDTGYLEQPHTSAGRMPTDAGFRVFVDRLQAGWSLRRHEIPAGLNRLADTNLPTVPLKKIRSIIESNSLEMLGIDQT